MMNEQDSSLFTRILDQNDRLINALISSTATTAAASDPVAIIKALNGDGRPITPSTLPAAYTDPWEDDAPPTPEHIDPWADPSVPLDAVHVASGGWVDIPGIEEAKEREKAAREAHEPVDIPEPPDDLGLAFDE